MSKETLVVCDLPCKLENLSQKSEDIDGVITFVVTILIIILYIINGINRESRRLLKSIKNSLTKDKAILSILDNLRNISNADRVVLGLVHNPSIYAANYHVLKLSILHESLGERIPSLKKTVKDITLTHLDSELEKFNKNSEGKFFAVVNSQELKEECKLYLQKINVNTIASYVLTHRKCPIGILSFQFERESQYRDIKELEYALSKNDLNIHNAKAKLISELI